MPDSDDKPADERTRDVGIPQVGETTVPTREEKPQPQPRKIHTRRPLPPVPKKENPKDNPDDHSNPET